MSLTALWHAMVAALLLCAVPALATEPKPPEEIEGIPVAMLVDLQSGQVLHARRPDMSFVPASMTKVMTAYVAFEEMQAGRLPADRVFTVDPQTANEWGGKGTSMFLKAGERVTTHELLRGIMTASANDASVVLAKGYAGSIPAWTYLMNDAARRLGMRHSAFNTPNGWMDEGRTYVSARDLIKLGTSMISRFPLQYRQYSGHKKMEWHDGYLFSHDPITGVVPGADGIKTGYTREAGYNFLGSAVRDGRRLIMVISGAKTGRERNAAARAYIEWGFSAWRGQRLFPKGSAIAKAKVQGGDRRSVSLVSPVPVGVSMPAGSDYPVSLSVSYKGPIVAPIKQGQQVAVLEIRVGDMPSSHMPLYARESVEAAGPMDRLMNGLMNLFS